MGMFLLVRTSSMTLCSFQLLVQEVPGFHPWGYKCQNLLVQEVCHVPCHCLTFKDRTNRLPRTSFTTNLCCPTCQQSKNPKLFCYTELWRWSLLYLGLISFWTSIHCLMFHTKHNILESCFVSVVRKKVGIGRKWCSYALFWQTQLRMYLLTEDSGILCCDAVFLGKGFIMFQRNVVPSFSSEKHCKNTDCFINP